MKVTNAVVFVGMAHPIGIIRHLALLGVELYKNRCGMDFYFASIEREPQKGSWNIIESEIPKRYVIKKDSLEELANACVELCKEYEKVIIHTGGGWGQTKHFVHARRRMDKMLRARLIFIGTTHSYRHDSFLRIPMSMFQYLLYRLFYKRIIFQCQYAADRFVGGRDLIRRGMGVVVPLGCEKFPAHSDVVPSSILEKQDLERVLRDSSFFKLVYLAAFRPGKMHVWLVHALAPLLKSYPHVRVLYCGRGQSDVIEKVKKAIDDEGVSSQIIMPGQIQREDIPWLLSRCDCAVVPSRSETFGHNFLEPMFAGLPVVGTLVGIGRDIIRNGETGYSFDLRDMQSLRDAIEPLVSNSEIAKEMGRRAKKSVESDFTHQAVAMQLHKVYNDVQKWNM